MNAAFQVLATAYYDGATEGFVAEQPGSKTKFFQVIAWDADQDQRLFAVVDIDRGVLSRLETLLSIAGQQPSTSVWVPEWRFHDEADTAEANRILAECKERLKKECGLEIGESLGSSARSVPLTEQLRRDVAGAIDRDRPDDLGGWVAKLP